MAVAVAVHQPFVLTKPGRITGVACWCATAGSVANVNYAVFAASATTGYPADKIADLSFVNGFTATGAHVTNFTGPILAARTLYWFTAWATQNAATLNCKGNSLIYGMRQTSVPTNLAVSGISTCIQESSTTGWSTSTAPATASPATALATSGQSTVPPMFTIAVTNT